ncbi:MAG TPA: hypothetical protein VJ816_03870 [Gemmatimonadales bacterium]|nr:hypothetical protein [Gemmatimonadales bacterium]
MRTLVRSVAIVALFLGCAATLPAQHPQVRHGGTTLSLGNVTAALFYYPVPTSGPVLKGGVGGSAFLWGHVGEVQSGSSVLVTGWKHTIFAFGLDLTIH